MVVSVPWRLKLSKQLNWMSTQHGQDHWTAEGWLYLSVIIDLFSRLVVGWALAERMTADLVCQALQMALWRRKMPKGVSCTQIAAANTVLPHTKIS